MQEMWVQSLGQEYPLEEEMATHFSTLSWRIPWIEEPGWLQPIESQRVGHDWSNFACTCLQKSEVKSLSRVQLFAQLFGIVQFHGLSGPWNSPGQNTGVCCHFLLQCLQKGTLYWLIKRLAVLFQETRQIHTGAGPGLWCALHRVRVSAPFLCGAGVGDSDALWALFQLLSGRGCHLVMWFLYFALLSTPAPLTPSDAAKLQGHVSASSLTFMHHPPVSQGPGKGLFSGTCAFLSWGGQVNLLPQQEPGLWDKKAYCCNAFGAPLVTPLEQESVCVYGKSMKTKDKIGRWEEKREGETRKSEEEVVSIHLISVENTIPSSLTWTATHTS